MTQLCLSQSMTSQWCNHSDYCCNHSDHLITIGHQQKPIVPSSFVNPLDTNCKINSQLSNETRHIFHHIMNILFAFQISMCDKSRNTWLCVHWQWNTLEWCQLNALQASPVVHLVTPLSCVSLSMNTQPSVPAIETFLQFAKNRPARKDSSIEIDVICKWDRP